MGCSSSRGRGGAAVPAHSRSCLAKPSKLVSMPHMMMWPCRRLLGLPLMASADALTSGLLLLVPVLAPVLLLSLARQHRRHRSCAWRCLLP